MMSKLVSGIFMLLGALVIGGWIANIYKMVTYGFVIADWGGMQVARVIGIFVAPLGAILGFF
ncbi:TPA: hypothetical protein PXM28_001514 [Yersinia enterocolitica]|uniref:hypothetical protein n=1 Tax=Yersinia frederiksenii TaxID=29484 RepID=UPI0005DB4735|nr:hypothetical protein [Yersinia frederiksenii]CQI98157.1 Uncharacterised protein [Yersinia frederiksenii]HDL6962272.1 hypothetical protein [Yersinia enterocolitica]